MLDKLFYPQEKVALFIDGANLFSAAKSLGFDIDYRRLLEVFGQHCHLIRAFYYTALIEDQDYSPIRPLVDWLDYNGYTMVTKPSKEFTDAMGRRKFKGNMDVELAIDMLEMAQSVNHVVLFSGDGDFRRLIDAVQRKGVRATVVSTIRSQPPMIADELRRQADRFLELDLLADLIARARVPGAAGDEAGASPRASGHEDGTVPVQRNPRPPRPYSSVTAEESGPRSFGEERPRFLRSEGTVRSYRPSAEPAAAPATAPASRPIRGPGDQAPRLPSDDSED